MSLSTEELFEGFIALLILVVAFVMVKVTIAFTATALCCSNMNINYSFKKDFSFVVVESVIFFARKKVIIFSALAKSSSLLDSHIRFLFKGINKNHQKPLKEQEHHRSYLHLFLY